MENTCATVSQSACGDAIILDYSEVTSSRLMETTSTRPIFPMLISQSLSVPDLRLAIPRLMVCNTIMMENRHLVGLTSGMF